jgi:hypothetical protein
LIGAESSVQVQLAYCHISIHYDNLNSIHFLLHLLNFNALSKNPLTFILQWDS